MMKLWIKIKELVASIRREKVYRLESVTSIAPGKITAVDNRGNSVEISTSECRKNFYLEFMGPEYTVSADDNMIGERNFMSEPKYILFYCDPLYYIELDSESYNDLREKLESQGLQTFDVT